MNVTFRMSLAKSIMKYIVTYAKRESFEGMTLGEIRRRPTLPGRFQPSTISVLRLNFCVRDGNRWIPQAIVTGNMGLSRRRAPLCFPLGPLSFASLASHPQNRTGPSDSFRLTMASLLTLRHSPFASAPPTLYFLSLSVSPWLPFRSGPLTNLSADQALDRLVSPSSIRYRTSTDDLSTLSSSRGLTCF